MRETTKARHEAVKRLYEQLQKKHPQWKRSAIIDELRVTYPYSETHIDRILYS